MLGNYLTRSLNLTQRLTHSFAKFDRTKGHVNGKYRPIKLVQSDTSIMERPPSPQPSLSICLPNKNPNISSMVPSTKLPKKELEVSPSTLLPLSTKQKLGIMLTLIALATSITSKI